MVEINIDFLIKFYYIADVKDSKLCAKQNSLRVNQCLLIKGGDEIV